MQKKKLITFAVIIIALLLLLIFSKNIINMQNKNKLNLSENVARETNLVEPNVPVLSAGMIPIKYENGIWVITEQTDKGWYSYSQGQPAYIMLNDGYYKSEPEQGIDETRLATVGVGVPDDQQTIGSIYMWIPRFEYNEDGEIRHVNGIEEAKDGFKVPEMFAYRQESETAPDFLMTGVWVAIDTDASINSTIAEMNSENGKYGFIKNTIATQITSADTDMIQKYIVGADASVRPLLNDVSNRNRTILKIINDKNQTPIKARGDYNELTGKVEITVTYTKYGIKTISDELGQELIITKQDEFIIANSGDNAISKGKHIITITDNKNNTKEMIIYKPTIYASLYSNGTLVFSKSENPEPDKELVKFYGEISEDGYNASTIPWSNEYNTIISVDFKDRIYPSSTAYWFGYCSKLTTINNISNLKTNKVTDMNHMFTGCYGLTSLDLRYFNTANVTNMSGMFRQCEGLTSLNLTSFDTRNVTNMSEMFWDCRSLTSLDLKRFKTENVTDMSEMFNQCLKLSKLDISGFDTSNVTNMRRMFWYCENLTSLNLTNFNTSNVTDMNEMFAECDILRELNLSSFDTSKVENMEAMFWKCNKLSKLDLSSFDTSNVTKMGYMFYGCDNLKTIYVGKKWTTANADVNNMFTSCGTNKVTLKN